MGEASKLVGNPVGLTLLCGTWVSNCGGFSTCESQALSMWASVVMACDFVTAAHEYKKMGSVVVAYGPVAPQCLKYSWTGYQPWTRYLQCHKWASILTGLDGSSSIKNSPLFF